MADIKESGLYKLDKGILPKDAFIVIVRTEWNEAILNELEQGCIKVLNDYGARHRVFNVPGAVEIPHTIASYWRYVKKNKLERPIAIIALGCVIKGDTPHFDYVCNSVTQGITDLNLKLPVPVIFGVLTLNTHEQALERIGGIHGHKGEEAAITALKMLSIKQSF